MSTEPEEKLDRKAFFRQGFRHLAKSVYSAVEKKVEKTVQRRVIRPPFAVSEAAFVTLCVGNCTKCLEACPHKAIFLSDLDGALTGAKRPRIAPSEKPCYLCQDFPCVTACPTGALHREDGETPKMGKVLLRSGCHRKLGRDPFCEYCVERCPVPGAISMDDTKGPVVNHDKCAGCGVCEYCCPAKPVAIKTLPLAVMVKSTPDAKGSPHA